MYKKAKGQPKVIIWRALVSLECPMLYTKFQSFNAIGQSIPMKKILKDLTIYEHGGNLRHVT